MNDSIQLRTWRGLKYYDPKPVLRRLREIELQVIGSDLPAKVRQLRTNEFKSLRERRDARPVQLKEWVPKELNPDADLQHLFARIARSYPRSSRTVVATNVNRAGTLDLPALEIPRLPIAELWLFGAIREDQSEWAIAGNMLREPRQYTFRYPWP